MNIYAGGEAIELQSPKSATRIELARVVGLIDIGGNNAENPYGWSGLKAVLNHEDKLYVLDHPEAVRLETHDGVFVTDDDEAWWPSMEDVQRYNLHVFKNKY